MKVLYFGNPNDYFVDIWFESDNGNRAETYERLK